MPFQIQMGNVNTDGHITFVAKLYVTIWTINILLHISNSRTILQPSLAKNISWYHKIWCQKLIFKTFVTNMLFRIFYFATA